MQSNSTPGGRLVSSVILKAASVAVLLLFVLWGRVFYGSMQDYKTAEAFLKENQTIRAITYFDRSLHWYAPLNPYVERSAKRLWEIGERAEQEKDPRMALIAYESIRNGFYGASHVFRPGKDWIQRAESKIQALSTLRENGKPAPVMKDPQPDLLWSVVVVLGLLGWIGSLLGYARWVLGKEKRSGGRMPRAALWIGLAVLFFALWILGMVFA
jgi:hypothetical protein